MSLSAQRLCVALCLPTLMSIACVRPPELACEVDFSGAGAGRASVVCEALNPPEREWTIKQMAQDELVRVRDFSVASSSGDPLAVTVRHDLGMGPQARRFAERVFAAEAAGGFRYRYAVEPGAPIGDVMHGSQGRRFGWLDASGALLSGRNLFLLPGWHDALASVRVRFVLPAGWRLMGTLPLAGEVAEVRGAPTAAHVVVSSIIGAGRFQLETRAHGRWALHVAAREDLDPDVRAAATEAAWAGYRDLVRRLGEPAADYQLVLAPVPPDGSMILLPPAPGGQGSEIAGAGPVQVYDLLFAMARGWTVGADTPFRWRPDDAWMAEALPAYAAIRATAATGVRSEAEAWRLRARSMRQEPTVLTGLPPWDAEQIQARRTKGAYLLGIIDALLRNADGGSGGLDGWLARLRQRGPEGFFDLLADETRLDWRPLRDLAAAPEAIPEIWLRHLGIDPLVLAEAPAGESPPPVGRLRILATAGTRGMLEVCGCKARQLGGIARRETLRRRILAEEAPVALVDLGNTYPNDRAEPNLGSVERSELSLLLDLMGRQDYAAAAIGHYEMLRGADFFLQVARSHPLPYVNSNLRWQGRALAPAFRVQTLGGVRLAWIGAIDPAAYTEDHARFYEQHLSGVEVENPLAAVARAARAARARADLLIVIGSLSAGAVRRLLDGAPEVDAILSTEGADAALGGLFGFPGDGEQSLLGFHGSRLVYFAAGEGRWLDEIDVRLDARRRIAGASIRHHPLREEVPDDPAFRARLARFYDRMKGAPELAGDGAPVARFLPDRLPADFVGAQVCRDCHEETWAHWDRDPHGMAFGTLVARHRNYAPRCIGCHVTGYGYPSGYRLGDPSERLRHVQCEMCHAPGGVHVVKPLASNIVRRPPAEVCFECHTPEHSDLSEGNFQEYFSRVVHRPVAGPAPPVEGVTRR
jgi:hypothetical protein